MNTSLKYHFLLIAVLLGTFGLFAQGVYTPFGENRVTHKNILWEKINNGNDEIIYETGQFFLAEVIEKQFAIEKKLLERELQYQLRSGVRVVVFTCFADYIQGNFGISNQQFYAGGYVYTPHNETFVYFNGDYCQLNKDIKRGIARVIINEMVMGGTMLERVQSSALITLPEWFVGGLASYFSESWNTSHDNLMRDAIAENRFKNFTSLDKDQSIFAGHSIWFFIERKYGKEKVRNILFHVRITRGVESGMAVYTGHSVQNLLREWNSFFKERYQHDEASFSPPRGEENKLNAHSKIPHTGMSLSPDGRYIAFVTNNRGAYKVWIYNISRRSAKLLLKGGYKTYTREPNYFFPVVKWVSNNKVAVLQERKGGLELSEYSILSGKKSLKSDLQEFDWVRGFSYSPDGNSLVLAAVKKGRTDLYLQAGREKTFTKLTDNYFDISEVSFIRNGDILFVSNTASGDIEDLSFATFNSGRGVFYYNMLTKESTRITPVDFSVNYAQPVHLGENYISFTSDLGGLYNSYLVSFEGKTLEYKDFKQLTNYNRSILFQDASAENSRLAELVFIKGRYRIYITNYTVSDLTQQLYNPLENQTRFRKELNQRSKPFIQEPEKLYKKEPQPDTTQANPQSEPSDTLVSETKKASFQTRFPVIDYVENPQSEREDRTDITFGNEVEPLIHVDYFLLRFLDNSIVGDYYFQGGIDERIFHSNLFSPHVSFSVSDMFNNHTIEAGMRIMGELNGSDYYIRYKNRVGRVNKEVFLNRRARYFDYEQFYQRNIMTLGGIGFEYPLSEKARLEGHLLLRSDQHLDLSIDSQTLFNNDPTQLLLGTRIGYVFDNTVSRGLNMLMGTRVKLFADPYFGLNRKGFNLMLGVDIRNYTKVDRHLTWANRFVANTSMGSLKTAYFLGGPENWYLHSFEGNVGNLRDPEFILQTLGAPVRGFVRNARSGTSYMVVNSELRLPLFSYLTQKPIRYEWLRSFMLIAFADLGTAWVGTNPYSSGNPYNTIIFGQPDMDISVTANRNPFILGTGVGARMKFDSYYIKYDAAWGFMEDVPTRLFHHFSLGLDF